MNQKTRKYEKKVAGLYENAPKLIKENRTKCQSKEVIKCHNQIKYRKRKERSKCLEILNAERDFYLKRGGKRVWRMRNWSGTQSKRCVSTYKTLMA